MKKQIGPKILLLDIETSPLISYTWGIWDQNIGLNQINTDWNILSWGAKWFDLSNSKVIYEDLRGKDVRDDKSLLKGLWKLLDEADIIVTQNGKQFDAKKINARFIYHGFQPPSSFKHIDTLKLAKKYFGFTSNKLEYMADKLNVKYKKLKHSKFPGFDLWKECLAGNIKAWKEMEKYNKHDVLSLEELYSKLIPWDNTINFNVYHDTKETYCTCGNTFFVKNGYAYNSSGKYQRYCCSDCGSEIRSKKNELSQVKKSSLKTGTSR